MQVLTRTPFCQLRIRSHGTKQALVFMTVETEPWLSVTCRDIIYKAAQFSSNIRRSSFERAGKDICLSICHATSFGLPSLSQILRDSNFVLHGFTLSEARCMVSVYWERVYPWGFRTIYLLATLFVVYHVELRYCSPEDSKKTIELMNVFPQSRSYPNFQAMRLDVPPASLGLVNLTRRVLPNIPINTFSYWSDLAPRHIGVLFGHSNRFD